VRCGGLWRRCVGAATAPRTPRNDDPSRLRSYGRAAFASTSSLILDYLRHSAGRSSSRPSSSSFSYATATTSDDSSIGSSRSPGRWEPVRNSGRIRSSSQRTLSFELWFAFLQNNGLAEVGADGLYRARPKGMGFLAYIEGLSYPERPL
jgi:hypothetical protein